MREKEYEEFERRMKEIVKLCDVSPRMDKPDPHNLGVLFMENQYFEGSLIYYDKAKLEQNKDKVREIFTIIPHRKDEFGISQIYLNDLLPNRNLTEKEKKSKTLLSEIFMKLSTYVEFKEKIYNFDAMPLALRTTKNNTVSIDLNYPTRTLYRDDNQR